MALKTNVFAWRAARLIVPALAAMVLGWGCAKVPVDAGLAQSVKPVRGLTADPGAAAARLARSMAGAPYLYGGESPDEGFDCSGLAWWAYASVGVDIPRVSWRQMHAGRRVERFALRPGDLLFFRTRSGKELHVGVYLGRSAFAHSPKSGSTVRVDRLDNQYWRRTFIEARRVANP
ncbi:MAG: murein DD-endopeptidase [Desulfovibrionales bacterium]|jgi:cell wall-associated NlpC family hydrolase|nr:murein DD-endopeptidase [Desulfovibrionales bacterium]